MYIYRKYRRFLFSSTMHTQEFIDYLSNEKRYSSHTIRAYLSDIEQFRAYLVSDYETSDLTLAKSVQIRSFVAWLIDHKTSTRSVNRKLTCLRSYYKYCLRQNFILSTPMNKVVSPRNSKRLPYYIEQEGMVNLFSGDRFEENFIGYRNKAILETFYGTGMRLNELRTLTLQHIDFDQKTLKVIGKRNKERIIPFGETMKKAILEYQSIKEESFENCKQNDFLFVSQSGNELDPKSIYLIVRKYTDQITTIGKRSPHILRHTFATHLLNEEAPLNAIKEMLGHSSLASTQIYSHNSISRLKNIYKQAHPRA